MGSKVQTNWTDKQDLQVTFDIQTLIGQIPKYQRFTPNRLQRYRNYFLRIKKNNKANLEKGEVCRVCIFSWET